MKKRWMKSILETSKQPAPILPFNRGARALAKSVTVLPPRKTAANV